MLASCAFVVLVRVFPSTQDTARQLGLTGWVRNLRDGRVELVACGAEAPLKELEQWLWQGPRHARVEQVAVQETGTESGMAKLSPADIGLLEIALTFTQQNAGSISADQNAGALALDVPLARQAIIVDASAQQKAAMTRNTLIAIMSDAFVTANGIYRVEKAKGKNPQNETFLEAYGEHFARGPQVPPANPPNP